MNALLPKFQTCLVRTHEADFHPGYWSFVDKQIICFLSRGVLQLMSPPWDTFFQQEHGHGIGEK